MARNIEKTESIFRLTSLAVLALTALACVPSLSSQKIAQMNAQVPVEYSTTPNQAEIDAVWEIQAINEGRFSQFRMGEAGPNLPNN